MTVLRPFVTVLIDTYNHERFIEQAVVSVLEQDVPPAEMEVIVVDDGSTDNTSAMVRKFTPRVRHICKTNGGQASAFNAGIPEAQGQIVAFLDGDDWWAPTKLRRVIEALSGDAAVGLVGHGITEVYSDGRQRIEVLRETPRFRVNSVEGALAFRLRKSFLGTSRMTFRTELLKRILPVPESLTIQADEYLFSLAALFADVLILPQALVFYRIHDANFYQVSEFQEGSVRRKQKVLSSLVGSLSEKLRLSGVQQEISRTITEAIQVEADQLRLSLDGGYPWETVQTELKLYRIMHERASLSNRVFKYVSLMPALVLPPRLFYHLRRYLTGNEFYLRARRTLIPFPEPEHVERTWRTGP